MQVVIRQSQIITSPGNKILTRRETKMVNKVVVSVVSIFLVVGVVIGAIVVVSKSNGEEKDLTSTNRMVNDICQVTDDRKLCVNTLDRAANSTNPTDFYKAAIEATIEAINGSIALPNVLIKKVDAKNTTENNRVRMAVSDCKDLLDLAIQDLQASFSAVGDSDLRSFGDRIHDIQTWLTAVSTYQTTCTDQLEEAPEIKNEMGGGILDAKKLTNNALAIVARFDKILGKLGFQLDVNPSSRRLFSEDGTPDWMSAADRKLMGAAALPKPNVVVAQDGSGQFKTISEALASYPKNFQGRYVIYVKAGIYQEYPVVETNMINILMYGDGPRKTMVTGDKSFAKGIPTSSTGTFTVLADGFAAKSMGFQNTAGPEGHQAVALRVNADMAIFHNCRIDGYQDTLYIHAKKQFYRNCVISGTVDFIFGNAQAVIQNSKIIVRLPGPGQKNMVTAHGREKPDENSGVVIQNCKIVPEVKLQNERLTVKTYLGRPWKEYSTAIFMENNLGDLIQPEGWFEWDGSPQNSDHCYFGEYANVGFGANVAQRVAWKGVHRQITKDEAMKFTVQNFIAGQAWIAPSGVPFLPFLKG